MHILNLSINKLTDSPYQGRFFSKEALKKQYTQKQLNELVNSIASTGLMQPITVRSVGENYEIIDGHRRVEAYKMLGKEDIPAIIKEASEQEIQCMTVVANIQRSNLSSLEKALSFEKILKNKVFKTRKELSIAIGKDETYIGDLLNLLKMDQRIIQDLAEHNSINDVRLLRLIRNIDTIDSEGRSDIQYSLYLRCLKENLTRSQLNDLIAREYGSENKTGFKLSYNYNGFQLKFNTKMPSEKKEQILALLEQKVKEIITELKLEG